MEEAECYVRPTHAESVLLSPAVSPAVGVSVQTVLFRGTVLEKLFLVAAAVAVAVVAMDLVGTAAVAVAVAVVAMDLVGTAAVAVAVVAMDLVGTAAVAVSQSSHLPQVQILG